MNCKQAEQKYTILDFLFAQNIPIPTRRASGYMIKSPFRSERTASFHIDPTGKMWLDHGDGESQGGGLVNLVRRWYNVDVSGALKIIAQVMGDSEAPSKVKPPPTTEQPVKAGGIELRCIQKLTDIRLLEYTRSRGIPDIIAVKYLRECYYSINGSGNFHALAFRNDEGGHELRNRKYQYASTPKAITTITGVDSDNVVVFEGFFDFLSAITYYEWKELITDVLVLNTLAMIGKALPILKKYKNVNLFLDNDPAGQDAVKKIVSKCRKGVNWSERVYPNHKDFNDFLTKSSS